MQGYQNIALIPSRRAQRDGMIKVRIALTSRENAEGGSKGHINHALQGTDDKGIVVMIGL